MKKTIIPALILTATCSTSAIAQTEGFYLGGEFGQSQLKITETSINEHANNYGIYAGYRFTNWFALEAKISKTADFHHNETITESYYEYEDYVQNDYSNFKTEFSATSASLTPTFYWQFNDTFSAFAKMGVSYTIMNIDYQIDNYAVYDGAFDAYGHTHVSDSYDGFSYALGIGFDSKISEKLTIRLSYDYTKVFLKNNHTEAHYNSYSEGYDTLDDNKVDIILSQFSLGLHYTF